MSTYIISDIHGCYDQYQELLRKIGFSDEDELYMLGDAMDRGKQPIQVMRDIMSRPNVTYILGNHDIMLLNVLQRLDVELTEENANTLTGDDLLTYSDLIFNGGDVTLRQYRSLSPAQQADFQDYLECSPFYETIEYNNTLYILVHAGLANFDADKELDEYDPEDLIWDRPDYKREYFPDGRIVLVTGHTPTPLIREDKLPLVYEGNGHLAIDCGCVFGGKLAAYCIETGEVTYVDGPNSTKNNRR